MRALFKVRRFALSDSQVVLCTSAIIALILDAIDFPTHPSSWILTLLALTASFYLFASALRVTQSRFRLAAFIIFQIAIGAAATAYSDLFLKSPLLICIPAIMIPAAIITPARMKPLLLALYVLMLITDFEYFLFIGIRLAYPTLTPRIMGEAIAQTDLHEAFEYTIAHGLIPIGIALVLATVLLYLKIRSRQEAKISNPTGKNSLGIIATVTTLALIGCAQLISSGPAEAIYEQIQGVHQEIQQWKDMKEARDAKINATMRTDHCCDTHIVIIGESTTRKHMGVYGYPLDTTPNMSASLGSSDFMLFGNTISPDVLTMLSLKKVLTNSTNDHPIDFAHSISIVQELKGAGYETTWLSNQIRIGKWDNEVGIIASGADHQSFLDKSVGLYLSHQLDQELLPQFSKAISSTSNRNRVIFVHLMGCHAPYSERTEKSFAGKFNGEPGIHAQTKENANLYDDAMLNNDFVVGRIVEMAKANHAASILYFSDHGEDVEFNGQHNPALYRNTMAEVPLMLWTSPEYASKHQQLMKMARANANLPFMTDGLFDTMLDLYDVSAPEYDATRSIVNPHFQQRQRWTMGGKKLYDEQPQTTSSSSKSDNKVPSPS